MNELALFAGAGGGILGGHLLGWRTVCAVEIDAYAASVLAQRQNDKMLPAFPVWSDVRSFDGRPWQGLVDVISGGFPCQDISVAGRGSGITGERSGLWREFARIIGEVRPAYAFIENSPMLARRGLGVVLQDLSALGYDAEWCVLGAGDCGAWHERERIWILANAKEKDGRGFKIRNEKTQSIFGRGSRWPVEPYLARVANGISHRVDRISALGNGQVPRVAAAAFNLLIRRQQARIRQANG